MKLRLWIGLLMVSWLGPADTLTLKSGKVIEGTFLGGDARQIRMAVGDIVQTFDVTDAASLQFGPAKREPVAPEAPAVPAAPVAPAAGKSLEVPAGTRVVVRMIDDVDSERDQVGKTFRASLDEPLVASGEVAIPRGADATIRLADDKESGKLTGRTELTLNLVSLVVNGRTVDVGAGEVTQLSDSRTGRTAKVVGGTAALGAIIGAIAGGGKGAAIGGLSGAGAGAAVQVLTKGQKVKIPTETRLQFTLRQPIRP